MSGATGRRGQGGRPVVAMITGHLTPYRVHINRRIAREIPEIRLRTLVTKGASTMWKAEEVPEIGTVLFDSSGKDWEGSSWPAHLRHEWGKGRALVRWLAENDAAAVISAGYDEVPNLMALAWCKMRGVPVYLTADSNLRSDMSRGFKRMVKRAVLPRVIRRFDGVMACGRLGRGFFEYYGAEPGRIVYVPLEPDYGLIERIGVEEIERVRRKYVLEEGRRRLVMCARLVALKRTDQVIDGFCALAAERPEWDLVIVGDGPERGALEARVPEGLRGRVKFLGFIADMAEIGAVYRASDALVLASMHEAWALVINEAACAGLAIAASDVIGAVPELVIQGRNGATFAAGDLEGLTAALRRVMDPAAIDRMKGESRKVLAEWRERADPVEGVRAALRAAGILTRPTMVTTGPG